MTARLTSIQTGRIQPLGPDKIPSGFLKTAHDGLIAVTATGLEGDQQADLSVHGGPDKAVYGYAGAHYPAWAAEFPALDFPGGAFGENLTIADLTEADICIGDVHAIGTARLQVCQPRQPCFKLALRHDEPKLVKAMVKSGRAGWYYRVLTPGQIRPGDALTLAHRPHPDFAFARLVAIVNYGKPTVEELTRMADMPELAAQWRAHAREALA